MNLLSYKTGYGRKVVPCFFLIISFFVFSLNAQEVPFKPVGDLGGNIAIKLKISSMEVADGYNEIADKAIELAKSKNLAEADYWRTLLHYKPTRSNHYKSLVDDPLFFCAKNGKTNPEDELEATIKAFFAPSPEKDEKHAIARFPGRFKWLCDNLNLNSSDFPYDGDEEYKTIIKNVNPADVYLVFPAGFLKNPASVFGHTFLLVESKGQTRLLANSINYGAVTTISGGVMYALLGLVGGFRGYYGFVPYYEKIKQYSNMDMRDMWEYRLTLSDEEKDRMLRHVFDLSGIYSRYFFISENCSYNLLFLIEAAKPETKISSVLTGVVEPIETVKLIEKLGLTDKTIYRASVYSKIENEKSQLTKEQNKYVKDVCYGKKTVKDFPFKDLPTETQIRIWNLASDYLTSLLNSRKISSEEYRPRFIEVLSARRKLGKSEISDEIKIPAKPETSHGSKKFALNLGNDAGGFYTGFDFRLSAHEQLESPAGYASNSQLVFGSLDVRLHPESDDFYLKKALIADVISLPSSDMFFFNAGMQFCAGLEQNTDKDKNENLAFRVKAFSGTSVLPFNWLQIYLLGGADCFFSSKYDYYTDLLLGGEAGFITTAGNWKNKIAANVLQSPLDLDHFRAVFSANECLVLSQNSALKAGYSANFDYDNFWQEYSVSFCAYF